MASDLSLSSNKVIIKKPLNGLQIPKGVILNGYGEFYVYSSKGEITKDFFEKIFPILNQFSIPIIAENPNILDKKEFAIYRHINLSEEVKLIDPNLSIGFIPRVLYELIFIRQCLQEDENQVCELVYRADIKFRDPNIHQNIKEKLKEKCWHLNIFSDEEVNDHEDVIELAFRMNQIIIKLFSDNYKLTHSDFLEKIKVELKFLSDYYYKTPPANAINKYNTIPLNFTKHGMYQLGIMTEAHQKIIFHVLAIECSVISTFSVFLYRGSSSDLDSVKDLNFGTPFSISYGSGLFSGAVHDATATPFHYIRSPRKISFAIPINIENLPNSVVNIHKVHTIVQLLGAGEYFHPRTKKWQGATFLDGISEGNIPLHQPENLVSNLDENTFIQAFNALQQNRLYLN